MNICTATCTSGRSCTTRARPNRQYCFAHDPDLRHSSHDTRGCVLPCLRAQSPPFHHWPAGRARAAALAGQGIFTNAVTCAPPPAALRARQLVGLSLAGRRIRRGSQVYRGGTARQ